MVQKLNNLAEVQPDQYLESIKAAKQATAVLKTVFATFASSVPEAVKILAVEGVDDKIIYYHWISKSRSGFQYEPYICKNKHTALRLYDVLQQDRTGLGNRVYFFVDKDFDGLQGRANNNKIYVTDLYSVENYIVCSQVLEDLLKIDFHCNGNAAVRQQVISAFEKVYHLFHDVVRDMNLRIFLARKVNIKQTADLPTKLNSIAIVELENVTSLDTDIKDLIRLEREPTAAELNQFLPAFQAIIPSDGYRGKFCLLFFIRWLSLLREDRKSESSIFFSKLEATEHSINGDFNLDKLASKSFPPVSFTNFITSI